MKHLTTQTIDGEAGAILSDCEQYRYRLWREWDRTQPALGFIMLNPSTADHRVNDPTTTKCLQRALAGLRPWVAKRRFLVRAEIRRLIAF